MMNSLRCILKYQKGLSTMCNKNIAHSFNKVVESSGRVRNFSAGATLLAKDISKVDGNNIFFRGGHINEGRASLLTPQQLNKCNGGLPVLPCFTRSLASISDSHLSGQTQQQHRKDISIIDDPFDSPTYNIPEEPVTFVEGASYSVFILAGFGVATVCGYFAINELLMESKEHKVFGKALERVRNDNQVRARIGSPISGYGQESRNRHARQQIPNRKWTDEDGVQRVEVNFCIRGPHGAGIVFSEMFKDKVDKQWKYTYLIVEIKSPSNAQLILESYLPGSQLKW
ncbi:hypothetical protein IFM89_009486 [Coptis chinensis]|uniref:Mitochondrial import inner membrane translocase subunit Tim21 n=1 Tax=Coptis chinensis TaxID=261450 RepID=A0A835I293_9MAGN|nr:hypothetical protein IFM89_009486 [Coptis chinensis]